MKSKNNFSIEGFTRVPSGGDTCEQCGLDIDYLQLHHLKNGFDNLDIILDDDCLIEFYELLKSYLLTNNMIK